MKQNKAIRSRNLLLKQVIRQFQFQTCAGEDDHYYSRLLSTQMWVSGSKLQFELEILSEPTQHYIHRGKLLKLICRLFEFDRAVARVFYSESSKVTLAVICTSINLYFAENLSMQRYEAKKIRSMIK